MRPGRCIRSRRLSKQCQGSMYKERHLNCSTSSVLSGIKSFSKRRTTTIGGSRCISSDRFATFSLRYIKIPILPQHNSPPPLAMRITFCLCHPRIRCATSLVIFTTTLHPQPWLALACVITLRWSLLPLPVPMHLPRPYPPHFTSLKASRMCHRSTTSAPLIRQPLKASSLLLPHQILRPLVQYETLSLQV